jgi:hypothetical protein
MIAHYGRLGNAGFVVGFSAFVGSMLYLGSNISDTTTDAGERPHDPYAHDQWLRENVQAALDDPRPAIPHDRVMARALARINNFARKKLP